MMNDLLELEVGSKEAAALAAPYGSVEDRKEIYLKYLIVSALKKVSSFVDMSDSLFYGRKFYSATRLFDFYVNNNLFDLIILRPDSNKLLFDVKKDDFHSNIFGYVVARIDEKSKRADILGYFLSANYDSIVNSDNVLKVTALTPIEDFENLEIMDSQMTLDEVSENFFDLMAKFLDDVIDDTELSELVCLLYNSAELREVFGEIGRFDRACAEMKSNADLLEDDLLTVLAGNKSELDEVEEYNLGDLDELTDDDSEQSEAFSLDTFSLDELANTEQELPEEILDEQPNEVDAANSDIDELLWVEQEPQEELLQDEDVLLPMEEETDIVNASEEEMVLTLDEELPVLEEENQTLMLTEEEPEELELIFDDKDESVSDIPKDEPVLSEEDTGGYLSEEKIATEEEFQEEYSLEETSKEDVSEEAAVEVESETVFVEEEELVDDELLSLLDDETDISSVDETEILSILSDEESTEEQAASDNENVSQEVEGYNEEDESISDFDLEYMEGLEELNETEYVEENLNEEDETEVDEGEQDINLLYNSENTATAGTFPGVGIVGSPNVSNKKFDTKKIISAAAFLAIVGLGVVGVSSFLPSNNSSDVASKSMDEDIPMPDDFQMPDVAKDMTLPESVPLTPPVKVSEPVVDESKIVSSLSKQAGAAPVILRSVAWQVPESITGDVVFSKYLQIAGKNIKLNLASDLLDTDDFAYNNKIKVSMTVKNNAPVKNVKILESSGSKEVDDIVLQSIRQTLKYINSPVMSTEVGDKEVILVISI